MGLDKDLKGLTARQQKKYMAWSIVRMLNSPWTTRSGFAQIIRTGLLKLSVTELTNLHLMIEMSRGIITYNKLEKQKLNCLKDVLKERGNQ